MCHLLQTMVICHSCCYSWPSTFLFQRTHQYPLSELSQQSHCCSLHLQSFIPRPQLHRIHNYFISSRAFQLRKMFPFELQTWIYFSIPFTTVYTLWHIQCFEELQTEHSEYWVLLVYYISCSHIESTPSSWPAVRQTWPNGADQIADFSKTNRFVELVNQFKSWIGM